MTSTDPLPPGHIGLLPAFAGAGATFSGIGLARFAYVPLFPAMVQAGWLTGGEAGLLGAINLAGYLAGVLGGRDIARRFGTRPTLNLAMALAILSFSACAWNGGATWLGIWRCLAGAAGGMLMALAGPAVQSAVPAELRGLAGGVVMTGVGAGVIVGALGVPAILQLGVSAAWSALAVLVALIWAAAARIWPVTAVPPAGPAPHGATPLYAAYGLSAAGLVPHMVYYGDFVVRGHGFSPGSASLAWLLFGVGGLLGPILGGRAADRWGASATLRIWLVVQVVALSLVFLPGLAPLLGAAFLGGFAAVGLTAVALARGREIAGPEAGAVWVRATAAFAVAQAISGFGLAALFARTGSHALLFGVGLALSVAALIPVLRASPLDATTARRDKAA